MIFVNSHNLDKLNIKYKELLSLTPDDVHVKPFPGLPVKLKVWQNYYENTNILGKVALTTSDLKRLYVQRKRKIQPEQRKDHVLKKLRAEGQEYPDRKRRGVTFVTPTIDPSGNVMSH
jgi:hypothetical protein